MKTIENYHGGIVRHRIIPQGKRHLGTPFQNSPLSTDDVNEEFLREIFLWAKEIGTIPQDEEDNVYHHILARHLRDYINKELSFLEEQLENAKSWPEN